MNFSFQLGVETAAPSAGGQWVEVGRGGLGSKSPVERRSPAGGQVSSGGQFDPDGGDVLRLQETEGSRGGGGGTRLTSDDLWESELATLCS